MKKQQNLILFIPGFKGSTLVNENNQLIWPNFMRAQFDKHTSLKQDPNSPIGQHANYRANDIVHAAPLIPKILSYDIYGSFIKQFEKNLDEHTKLLPFFYDWRDDLEKSVEKLKGRLDKHCRHNEGTIDLICHSMGGLLATALLANIAPKTIRYLFFVSTAFKGAPKTLLDLANGSKLGFNRALLSSKAIASFYSLYYLLPQHSDFIDDNDLFELKTWKNLALESFVKDSFTEEDLEKRLVKAKRFYENMRLLKSAPLKAKKLIFVNNQTLQTPTKIKFKPHIHAEFSLGDGTIPAKSLKVPSYLAHYPHDIYAIDKVHAKSFKSKQLLDIIQNYR